MHKICEVNSGVDVHIHIYTHTYIHGHAHTHTHTAHSRGSTIAPVAQVAVFPCMQLTRTYVYICNFICVF